MSYFLFCSLLLLFSIVSFWWKTSGAPVEKTIRPISDERYRLIYDIISGTRTINERKATLEEKNAARMIRRWKKHYPLTVAKCHNPLTGTEENRLMVDDFAMPFEVEWFGVGGMTASQPCPNLIFKMARYSPDIVVVCLGGNDISSGAEPSTVIDCLTSLFHRIRDFAPRQPDIFFTEIVSRGKFRSSLQREEFDGKRRTVNNKMKKILGRTFIRIDVRFPRHYLPDGIHFNDAGTVIFLLSISKTVKSRSFE
ncbi:uncharacterized protein [Magallana gigas]|uniref:uncharacterized protein n=1 Tax=Magallana gigas TaxID=29159 RepID=UPI0033402BE2